MFLGRQVGEQRNFITTAASIVKTTFTCTAKIVDKLLSANETFGGRLQELCACYPLYFLV